MTTDSAHRTDLLLRHATLADGTRADVAIADGRITWIAPQGTTVVEGGDGAIVDLEGALLLPSFVDLHMHLDKALTLEQACNTSGTLQEAIDLFGRIAPQLTYESYYERALRTLRLCLAAGTTAMRTHVNVYGAEVPMQQRLGGLPALLALRQQLADVLDLQLVLLPSGFLADDPVLRAVCEEGLRLGADALGGCPALEPAAEQALDAAFTLAMRFDRPLDLHVDETDDPTVCTLSIVAEYTRRYGYERRVTVGHCCSLASMEDERARPVIEAVAAAQIAVVTLPSCNLYLQGRHDRHAVRRGLTRVKELAAAGVNVAAASDNIRDPFNPFGRGDLLQIADLLSHAAHLGSPTEQALARDAISANPRACFTGTDPRPLRGGMVRVGDAADLVACATDRLDELIAEHPVRRLVLHRGRIVARTQTTCEVLGVGG